MSLPLCESCPHHLFLPARTNIVAESSLWHGTNLSSNDAERQTALNCISNTEHHIAKLDNALARISRILDSMKVQRDILIHDRDNLKALLMPIRHIPNELWMKILPAAIQGTDLDFSLFQVCRQWRGLLFSSSQLFDRVQLNLANPNTSCEKWTRFLTEYITRLHGGIMVSRVDIVFPEPWKYCVLKQGSRESAQFIRSLKKHMECIASSSCWQSVTHLRMVNYSPNDWDQVFWGSSFRPPSRLEYLAIELNEVNHRRPPDMSPSWDSLFATFKDRCQHLCWMTIPDGPFNSAFESESRMVVVNLTATDAHQAMQILRQHAVSLTEFTMQSARTGNFVPNSTPKLVLDQLHHLAIEAADYDIHGILGNITCPSLVSLHLCGVLDWEAVSQFIVRSGCTLETLSIGVASKSGNREYHDVGLINILRSSPSIQRFTYFEPSLVIQHENYYSGSHMSEPLLTALDCSSTSTSSVQTSILPKLEHLVTRCPSSQLDAVLTMAESRQTLKLLGIHLLESRPVHTQSFFQYYASDKITVKEFELKTKTLRQQNVGVYQVRMAPGTINPRMER
ncbi:hypothetical protein EV359DRAFT_68430 [Lentinula novae-zelandiae]|nr:hypothetical protein EV359DRAFT_68430 [Lentinula novae-zelandiae]